MIEKISIDSIGKFIAFALPRRKTKLGLLFAYLFLIFIFYCYPTRFLTDIKRIVIYAIEALAVFIVWLFISGRMIIPSKKIRIAFAFKIY